MRTLDRRLRRRMGVFEFTDDPGCLFRVRLIDASGPLAVPDGALAAGTPVLELHLWNERIPRLPARGADLAWASRSARLLAHSCRTLAGALAADPRFARVRAVGGSAALASDSGRGAEAVFHRLGFAVTPLPRGIDDVHSWLLMWAYNPGSASLERWRHMRRAAFWTTRERFLERFAPPDHGC